MCQTTISLYFVCKLCRGSFGQVDAFIEHKKQKHFNEFQNTTCIVFEEREDGTLGPVIIKEDPLLPDENNEPPIKIEVNEDDFIIHVNSEIVQEPNLDLVEPKSELITFESEVNPDNENNYLSLEQPEQNPYVLLKRLTPDEIQSARFPQHHFTVLKYEQEDLANSSDPCNSSDDDGNATDPNEVENPTENQPSSTFVNISTEQDLGFECKLCSKQLESDAKLKIHVGICALYHTDRKRFCVTCNRKLCDRKNLKRHRLRFHGTEEEKLSLQKFKCHLCPKRYRDSRDLGSHLKSHKNKKQQVKIRPSNSKLLKCSHPNCGKEFEKNSYLQKHIATSHFGLRPYSCSYPNCDKTFRRKDHVDAHCCLHTGDVDTGDLDASKSASSSSPSLPPFRSACFLSDSGRPVYPSAAKRCPSNSSEGWASFGSDSELKEEGPSDSVLSLAESDGIGVVSPLSGAEVVIPVVDLSDQCNVSESSSLVSDLLELNSPGSVLPNEDDGVGMVPPISAVEVKISLSGGLVDGDCYAGLDGLCSVLVGRSLSPVVVQPVESVIPAVVVASVSSKVTGACLSPRRGSLPLSRAYPKYKRQGLCRGLALCVWCNVKVPLVLTDLLRHWKCGVADPTNNGAFIKCPLCLSKKSGRTHWKMDDDKGYAIHLWKVHEKEAFTPAGSEPKIFAWKSRC